MFNDNTLYLHCKHCIPGNLPDGISPEEFGSYQVEVDREEATLTITCKHCKNLVVTLDIRNTKFFQGITGCSVCCDCDHKHIH